METKEANGNPKVIRLKADEKMYDQWKIKLENAFKMKLKKEKFSSDDDSEDERKWAFYVSSCLKSTSPMLGKFQCKTKDIIHCFVEQPSVVDPMDFYEQEHAYDEQQYYYGENGEQLIQTKSKRESDSSFDYNSDHENGGTKC